MKLRPELPPDVGPDDPVTRYELELDTSVDALAPGNYSATLTSFVYSDVRISGEPPAEVLTASCSTDFNVDVSPVGIAVVAAFADSDCTVSIRYILVAAQVEYELTCGPIEPTRCRELAGRAVEAAVLRNPGAHPVSLEFFSVVGDYTLVLDNGTAISLIID